ncbi:non-ribosomal peptide synthetase [Fulvivirga ligni]|uniref:non-ribosomal peptide synthetase n=1 Tax=Fulvivirga ligni TaxID=2904246 RepID=UPI001F344FB7|nr:non-ribosomal peptide synthetase [Fulvivirga ligni]UII23763.1 amino acid adenylation domain-containing protein [Fulvivirga ligni]
MSQFSTIDISSETIQETFLQSFQQNADQLAISSDEKEYTYGELNRVTNEISLWLQHKNLGNGKHIALYIEDKSSLIIWILAVLKARSVFIPLDTNHPIERIIQLVGASECNLIISDAAGKADLKDKDICTEIVVASEIMTDLPKDMAEFIQPEYDGEDKVYIYFTSGSSGTPKAIVGKNLSLNHFINWEINTFNIDSTFKVSQFINPGFDAFLRDIFSALVVGGTICIPSSNLSGDEIIEWIDKQKITLIHCVPSFFKLFLSTGLSSVKFESLRYILMSGEKLNTRDLSVWYQVMGNKVQLVNLYGPSETTMIRTFYLVQPGDAKLPSVPIGKPISGTQIFLLDKNLRPVGEGHVGEIFIRTKYGTHGYLDKELNKGSFIANPYANDKQDFLYKTGDLGRFNPQGDLEFLGRVDRQVKIRGVRIEPAEIEIKLQEHPVISNAVVKAFTADTGGHFLCAYMVRGQHEITASEVRQYLHDHLPAYLIPDHLIFLETLPLLTNGKIDERSLPDPRKIADVQIIPPKTQTQKVLVEIWAEILDMDINSVSVETGFMDLGGHSLKLLFLGNQIMKRFSVDMELTRIVELQTIVKLGEFIDSAAEASHEKIPKVETRDFYPLSSSQKRLFYLHAYDKESLSYNMTQVVTLNGKLSKDWLEKTFERLIERHESLRTRFGFENDEPVQYIADKLAFKVNYLGKQENIADAIHHFIKPFDLSQASVFRVGVIEVSSVENVLIIDNHHIISDGLSHNILLQDFMSLYNDEELPELHLQYKDYAVWQQSESQKRALSSHKEYWLNEFADNIPELSLPVDYSSVSERDGTKGTVKFTLGAVQTDKLRNLAGEESTTLFVVLLSIYNILLSKLANTEDVIIGTSVSGRSHADLERVTGVFINALALRNYPHGGKPFREFLKEVNKRTFDAFEHQKYPYEDLIEALNLQRDSNKNPLFNVMFEYFNFDQPELTIDGLKLTPVDTGAGAAKFDITLRVNEVKDYLDLSFQYASDKFKEETIIRFTTWFERIAEHITEQLDTQLMNISLLSSEDYDLLALYNKTTLNYSSSESLVSMFEQQVSQHPDRVAISFGGESLTYKELNEYANRVAHYLLSVGVVPGSVVALLLDRSLNMLIGIFGVLKAGAGYLPLDPDLPEQRVSYMLDQSRAGILLSQANYLEQFSAYLPVQDIDSPVITDSPNTNPGIEVTGSDLAYCIFTSGSSGRPKGVMMSQGSVINLVKGLESRVYNNLDVSSGLRVVLVASYSFDASGQQIFGALLHGHSLYITEEDSRRDGGQLLSFYNTHSIDVSDGTPTHLRMLVNSLEEGSTLCLQSWILAGEALPKDLVLKFYSQLGEGVQLYNFYGPTETCIDSTGYRVELSNLEKYDTIPIGKPLPNERVYVTDRYGKLVSPGVIGELCIAGDGLARCYAGEESLTTEKFSTGWVDGEDRVYRTGDLVKWLPCGNLSYHGRMDDQVKLRGYRVELQEIEHRLSMHESIHGSVVLINDDSGDEHLVAYYESEFELSVEVLRHYLESYLPSYMVPSYYVHMHKLPLTVNGKLNRRELPAYEHTKGEAFVSPTTDTELKLASIWGDVLKLDPESISVNTGFFDLGGHSLKLVFLANKIRKELGAELSLTQIIELQTIARLAAAIVPVVTTTHSSIPKASPSEYYPLSPSQKRLYFLHSYNKESLAYNMTQAVTLKGVLDREKLDNAFKSLISRHDSLRTSFDFVDGVVVQRISDFTDFQIEYLEPQNDIENEVLSFIRPFDLSQAPLIRAGVIEVASDEHVLVVDNHHIISDGVTNGILLKEFMALYAGHSLPSLPLQYHDYVVWQQQEDQQAVLASQKDFWVNEFIDEVEELTLPMDYSRPLSSTNEGGIVWFNLGKGHTSALKALAGQENTTLFVVMLSIYNLLLGKLANTEDVVVGTSVSGRSHSDLESVTGVFINALALRNHPHGSKSFREFLREVNKRTFDAFEHQDYPYEDLVEALNLNRDSANRHPLFNVMFEYFNFEHPELTLPGLTLEPFTYELGVSRFDLTLRVKEENEQLILSFQYSGDLFKRSSVESFALAFEKLTDVALKHPESAIMDMSMVSEYDLSLLSSFNNTSLSYAGEAGLVALFEKQVSQYPDRVAVVFKGESLTYSELNERANQVANYLLSSGVTQGSIVALQLDRSVDILIGILGVLKGGAGYLPIDPDLPEQRINYMLAQSGAEYLLYHSRYQVDKSVLPVVAINAPVITDSPNTNPGIEVTGSDLAYCIFTSGSSGRPKGVMMSQGSVINLVKGLESRVYNNLDVSSGLRVALVASYSFDASGQQIFGALLHGHSLYITDEDSRRDGGQLLSFYNTHSIDVSDGTPTHLRMLVNSLEEGSTLCLQSWILAGEALPKDLVLKFYSQLGEGVQLYNFYGPTETCIDSTGYRVELSNLEKYDTIPIGKPLPNERVYVTDRYGKLVSPGVIGELCIAGDGLARCYAGEESLTTEKFSTGWVDGEDRVYRTGDLVKWLPCGNLSYHGRMDDQVKLRGYRVELQEIEHRLSMHESIHGSVVLINDDSGDEHLVAYYESEFELSVEVLRHYLESYLPSYMVPSYYVHMHKLPLTVNGKLNRRELPAYEHTKGEAFVSPTTDTELKLASIWGDVLKLDPESISVNTGFFDLGGHSLKLVFLANKIRKELGAELSLTQIIELQTIARLAAAIVPVVTTTHSSIPKASPSEYYPLSPSQKRLYFLHSYNKESLAYNMTQAVTLKGVLDREKLDNAFKSLISRHDSLRTSFDFVDGVVVQRISDFTDFQIEYLEPQNDIENEVLSFIRPFDLSQAPLIRAGVIEVASDEHVLVVDNHHIISDGVTNGILLKEFMALYAGHSLPSLPLQYHDYVVWQQQEDQQAVLASQKDFWVNEFIDEVEELTLPMDYSRPLSSTNEGGIVWFNLGKGHTSALKALAGQENTTLFVVMLSIYNLLLGKLANTEDVVVGTSVSGRSHSDLESVTGVFINALALRNHPHGSKSFREFLREVNKRTFDAFEHQDYPYEDLVEALNLNRDSANRHPLFNVMFEYFNFEHPELTLPGLTLEPYKYDPPVSRFDLTLRVNEENEQLILSFQYSGDLFKRSSVESFALAFEKLTDVALKHPESAIMDMSMVSEYDLSLLSSFNNTSLSYAGEAGLVALFEKQVSQYPDRVAVVFKGESLTYSELNERANQVANYLLSSGVTQGSIVALQLDRSVDILIGILGVLKGGAGYLPIDPDLPEQRINYMLAQSGAEYLLYHSRYQVDKSVLPVVAINAPVITDSPNTNPGIEVTGSDLAYCIFTSGSSGRPKGVMMSQGSVINLVKGLESRVYNNLDVSSGLRVALVASYSFDASGQQIFGALLHGHSLYITDEDSRRDGGQLLSFYNTHSIDVSDGTPTHLRMLVNSLEEGSTLCLQSWILAGEALPKDLVLKFYSQLGEGVQLYNFYGPTETCIDSTGYRVELSNLEKYDTIPIGKPLPNERVYVTDRYGKLVSPGVIGELCIAGDGLARCYAGEESLTTEKFSTGWVDGEDRVYRTGDLVKWLPCGNLSYHGRMDDQVKLRGYRVELQEIEHRLSMHESIHGSVVLINDDSGDEHLVAYYESEFELSVEVLRHYLESYLPSYMVPSYYVHMHKLPLTVNGKLNRRELPAYEHTKGEAFVSPTTDTELKLASIWGDVLKLDPESISVNTGFFDLGGHSLNAIQIANSIKKVFGSNLKLADIFEKRTIRQLAELIEMDLWLDADDDLEDNNIKRKETII